MNKKEITQTTAGGCEGKKCSECGDRGEIVWNPEAKQKETYCYFFETTIAIPEKKE